MSLPTNPFFHSQTRRKSESAAIPIRDRDVRRNAVTNHVARSPSAPPVPPKDEPPGIASAATPAKVRAKKSLCVLEKEWMLNDCLQLVPTPVSEGGLAQEYIPRNVKTDEGGRSQNVVTDIPADAIRTPYSSEGTLLAMQRGSGIRATKRDTVAVLMDDIMGNDKEILRRHQDILEAAATLGDIPTPLRVPKKPSISPCYSSTPPVSKFNKLYPDKRPSLNITTAFTEPRSAPIPPGFRRSDVDDCKHAAAHPYATERRGRLSKSTKAVQLRNSVPYPTRQSKPERKTSIQPLRNKISTPQIKQRRANSLPKHSSVHTPVNIQQTSLQPPQCRNTQPTIINRMRDPDETFHDLLAVHKRAVANFEEVIPTATTPKLKNGRHGSAARYKCTGLYLTAKSHADDLIEHVKNLRRKNRKRKQREQMMGEVRRKYEEMLTANASAGRGDEL